MSVKPRDAVDAVRTSLEAWLFDTPTKDERHLAVDMLYIIALAMEYLNRLNIVGEPDPVTRLKRNNPFLVFVYDSFPKSSPASRAVARYLQGLHARVLSTLLHTTTREASPIARRKISRQFLEDSVAATYGTPALIKK